MIKTSYRFILIQILFCSFAVGVKAQTTPLALKTDQVARLAIRYLNAGQPDSVYALTGAHFRHNLTAAMWHNAYRQLSGVLPFTQIIFISSKDSINQYQIIGKKALTYAVSMDWKNQSR